ncbi:hypothetical protein [Streptomyces griseorubiginosus]|uniref:hypothetical protein n=1 Tax=Streptomyces griseorubiginosus TaxID=67304 RepID=UPI0034026DC9
MPKRPGTSEPVRCAFRVCDPVPENVAQTLPEPDVVMPGSEAVFSGLIVVEVRPSSRPARFRTPELLVTEMRPPPY